VLAEYYAVADLAFVGGSLVPRGGHNPLEPAACGVTVLMGPSTRSQQSAVDLLVASGALMTVEHGAPLRAALAELTGDAEGRARRGAAGRQAVDGLRGVADRAVARLEEWKLWPAG
jgi:3-deoxy-D-manno-octulosonic-acid transferase